MIFYNSATGSTTETSILMFFYKCSLGFGPSHKFYLLKSSLTKKRCEYECTTTTFNLEILTCKLFHSVRCIQSIMFFSQTSTRQQPPVSNIFFSQQISISHQPHHNEARLVRMNKLINVVWLPKKNPRDLVSSLWELLIAINVDVGSWCLSGSLDPPGARS